MVRVDDQDGIQEVGFPFGEFTVRPQHVEDVLRDGVFRPGIMDDQGMAVEAMDLGLIGVAGDGRELGQQVESLEQGLVDICRVRVLVVIVQGQGGSHQAVHQVLGGIPQQFIDQELIGQVISVGQSFFKIYKGIFIGQKTEQEEETGLLVTEIAFAVADQILDGIAPVEQFAFRGRNGAVGFLTITDNIGHPGQADPDAGPVIVSKPFLYIVFMEQVIGNIRIVGGFSEIPCENAVVVKGRTVIHRSRSFLKSYICIQLLCLAIIA